MRVEWPRLLHYNYKTTNFLPQPFVVRLHRIHKLNLMTAEPICGLGWVRVELSANVKPNRCREAKSG